MAKGAASKAFVWVILGLLFVGLAGFGATNFGGSVRAVGQVGDTEIESEDYARALQQELRAISAQTGTAFPLSQAQAFGIPQTVLGRLVGEAALEDESARIGLSVGDEEVRRQVLQIPAFQGIDGQFDREAYTFALQNAGLSIAEFEETMRADTARQILTAAVTAGVATPDVFTDTIYAWARETRDVTWAQLRAEDLDTARPVPSESDLATFHAENPELFTAPETRALSYVSLTPEAVLATIEVDEDSLRALYDARRAIYVLPERRLVERLVFADDAAAAAAAARLASGEIGFEDLVAERGLDLADIDLGDVALDELGEAGAAVFAVDQPQVVGPAPSPLGPALFRINAILAASETTFDEALPELRAEEAADRATRVIDDLRDGIEDLLAGGATLEEVAAETEMTLGQIDWTPASDSGIAAYPDFRAEAARVTADDFPTLFELNGGGLAALRLDALTPPALRPLDEVRADVIAAWDRAQLLSALEAEAQAMSARLRAGTEMASLGLALNTERGLGRDTFIEATPPEFIEAIFASSVDDVLVVAGPDGVWLARIDRVAIPDGFDAEAQTLKARFAETADQDLANDLLTAFTQAVIAQSGTTINQAAINAVHAQFP